MREGLQKVVSFDETIVAISTPIGHSGIGVVRISGSRALDIARKFLKGQASNVELQHRIAVVGTWLDVAGEPLDQVVVTFFHAPHSYTGENVVEINAHGNPFSLRRIVESALDTGARLANAGEFTLRAVVHGKMDLIQAEAVREYIEAQTEQQSKTALRQIEGSTSKRLAPIKARLLDLIAYLEAGIDFAEDDIEVPSNDGIAEQIGLMHVELDDFRRTFGYGKLLSKGLRIAIVGKPNVGKSSLFNRLVCSDRAIVTDIPGTTRDVVTEAVSLDGVPLCFADTAGVRETTNVVETIGISRTLEELAESDFAIIVLDGSSDLDREDRTVLEKASSVPHLIVINKADLVQKIETGVLDQGAQQVSISARTGHGLDTLLDAVKRFLWTQRTDGANDVVLTNARQYETMTTAADAMQRAMRAASGGVPHEMVLLDLYEALTALGELTGEVVTDDILDRIFSTFCIGK